MYGQLLDNSYPDGADLITIAQGYPDTARRDEVLATARSEKFTPPSRGDTTVTAEFDGNVTTDVPFYYWFALAPSGIDYSDLNREDMDFLGETDRLREQYGDLGRYRHSHALPDDSTTRYTRRSAEGCYYLEFSGRSYRKRWTVNLTAYKHAYIDDLISQAYSDRRYYVYEGLRDGFVDQFGRLLDQEAEANGFTGDREKIGFLIDFVQNLPYLPDDVSTGYDDYTKRNIETLVDGGGDCEDSALMLASLLLSDSFGYGTALLLLPGHAALGVKGADTIDGYYYTKNGNRYYYVETTGSGWDVGEIPDEYRNEEAYIYVF